MHLRDRIAFRLLALAFVFALALPAWAAKPAPTQVIPVGAPPSPSDPGMAATQCQMGIVPPAANRRDLIINPPDDRYYTLLTRGGCPTCPQHAYRLSAAHVQLSFSEHCSIPVTVSVVAADVSIPGCAKPIPEQVVCPPAQFVLSDGGVLNNCVDFTLPLPAGCCVDRDVFLEFRFDNGTCVPGHPWVCGPPSCADCQQYNIYPGSPPGGDDLCQVLSPFGTYGIIMYADAECCASTPTLPGTWGHLKTLYH